MILREHVGNCQYLGYFIPSEICQAISGEWMHLSDASKQNYQVSHVFHALINRAKQYFSY